MKKYKNKAIAIAVILGVLSVAFLHGGGLYGAETPSEKQTAVSASPEPVEEKAADAEGEKTVQLPVKEEAVQTPDIAEASAEISVETDEYMTEPVPDGNPLPVEPQETVISDTELTCTLSVSCDTALSNIGLLDAEKADIIPKDGVIFAETEVTFYEGESVFNVLLREMKRNKIHFEFVNTPIYNSAYMEGIGNLYEFDCGELSGWMYRVNGWFPSYGCSRYGLKAGDKVEVLYTCDLGADIGGDYSARNGR